MSVADGGSRIVAKLYYGFRGAMDVGVGYVWR